METNATNIYVCLKRDFSDFSDDLLLIEDSDLIDKAYKKIHTDKEFENLTSNFNELTLAGLAHPSSQPQPVPAQPKNPNSLFDPNLEFPKSKKAPEPNPFTFDLNLKNSSGKPSNQDFFNPKPKNPTKDLQESKVYLLQRVNLEQLAKNSRAGQLNNKISQNRSKKLTILEQQNPYHTESGPQDTIKTSKVDQHKFFSSIDSESSAGTGTAVYNVITVQRIELEKSEKLRTIKFDNHSGNLPKN